MPTVDNFDEIANRVSPPISKTAAKSAIQDLERMGLIVRNNKGQFVQSDSMITFGEEWKSVVIREFQHQALDLQKQALERYPAKDREIAHATLCMSKDRAEVIKSRLQVFRKELISIVKSDPQQSEQVYQLNFGFFPLSKGKSK